MPLFAARTGLDFGPADTGRRLTLRYRDGRDHRELVGLLYRWSGGLDDGILRLRRRDGAEEGVRVPDIVSGRVVAPEISAYAMQRLCQDSWPPIVTATVAGWQARASAGATARANSVRVAGAPTQSLRGALGQVRGWYHDRQLPARLQLTSPNGLESELADAGWTRLRYGRVLTTASAALLTATSGDLDRQDLRITTGTHADESFLAMLTGYGPDTAGEYAHVMAADLPGTFVFCRSGDGTLLGVGHAVRLPGWCTLTAVRTTPQSRRAGIASAVTATLARWVADQGCPNVFLQLFEDNSGALGFYERLGFTTHHRYEYRWHPKDPYGDRWPETAGAGS